MSKQCFAIIAVIIALIVGQIVAEANAQMLSESDRMALETDLNRTQYNIGRQMGNVRNASPTNAPIEQKLLDELIVRRDKIIAALSHNPRIPLQPIVTLPQNKEVHVGGFVISNACGQTFTKQGAIIRNGTDRDTQSAQEEITLTLNQAIGWQSWGCHVRPEPPAPTVIIAGRSTCYREPVCATYGAPAPRCYPSIAPTASYPVPVINVGYAGYAADPRNPVVTVPPGIASPGCRCRTPGQIPGRSCICGPSCRECQGTCSTRNF